jgi:hypothetical protein
MFNSNAQENTTLLPVLHDKDETPLVRGPQPLDDCMLTLLLSHLNTEAMTYESVKFKPQTSDPF